MRQALTWRRTTFGGFAEGIASGRALHHGHGSHFVADDYQREFAFLGIKGSPAVGPEPEGSGGVECFIQFLRENQLWARRFATIEEPHPARHAFEDTDNPTWIVERHGYLTRATVSAALLAPLPVAV